MTGRLQRASCILPCHASVHGVRITAVFLLSIAINSHLLIVCGMYIANGRADGFMEGGSKLGARSHHCDTGKHVERACWSVRTCSIAEGTVPVVFEQKDG